MAAHLRFARRAAGAVAACIWLLAAASAAGPRPSDPVTVIAAAPERGFNFPYVLYVPDSTRTGENWLLVEGNNSGTTDDYSVHVLGAIATADGSTNSIGHLVAKREGFALLVPAFPRPESQWRVYTHALDRETMKTPKGPLLRLDLQLIAMVHDAQAVLARRGMPVHEQILINGFSASGTFANRFTFLHPELVRAAAYGGINGILMLPRAELGGRTLDYPLGIHDFAAIAGKPFDFETYRGVAQFAYMGADDTNDTAPTKDSYSDSERDTIYRVLGRQMQPERWQKCQALYTEQGIRATFRTYAGMGHGTNRVINTEVCDFFHAAVQ